MPFIGLTGNLGHGKTMVLKLFEKKGAHTINADKIVHGLLKKRTITNKLAAVLGKEILTGGPSRVSVNRKRMADVIFNDPKKRKAAEKIIHPQVIRSALILKKQILKTNKRAVIIFEIPLLFEAGYQDIFDAIIVVYCSRTTAMQRLMKTGMSKEAIRQRTKAQMPVSRKKAMADYVINNNSDLRRTRNQVKTLLDTFLITSS
jgi:dephospho-CoA kinase